MALEAPPTWDSIESDPEFQKLDPMGKTSFFSKWDSYSRKYAQENGLFEDPEQRKEYAGKVQEAIGRLNYDKDGQLIPVGELGAMDSIINSVARGWRSGQVANAIANNEGTPERIAELQTKVGELPTSSAYSKVWDDRTPIGEAWEIFKKEPAKVLGELVGESLGMQAASQLNYVGKIPERTLQGAVAGTGIGAAAAGVGAIPGLAAGTGLGFAQGLAESSYLASLSTEYSSNFISGLQEAGVDVTDKESLRKAFENPAKIQEIKDFATKKAVPVGVTDGLMTAIGGRIFSAPAKKIAGKVGQWAAEMGIQSFGGMGGETASQLIASGEITSPRSILAEGIAEPVSAVPEIAIGRTMQGASFIGKQVGKGAGLKPSADPQVNKVEAEILGKSSLMQESALDRFIGGERIDLPQESDVEVQANEADDTKFAPPQSDVNESVATNQPVEQPSAGEVQGTVIEPTATEEVNASELEANAQTAPVGDIGPEAVSGIESVSDAETTAAQTEEAVIEPSSAISEDFTGDGKVIEPTEVAAPQSQSAAPAVGNKVQLGRSPQTHEIIEELPQTDTEKSLGERYYRVRNTRTGEEQTIEQRDIRKKGKPEVRSMDFGSVPDLIDAVRRGEETPFTAINQTVQEAEELRSRVQRESERRAQPRRRGRQSILDQINRAISTGRVTEEQAAPLRAFVLKIPKSKLEDVAMSLRATGGSTAQGEFNFRDAIVSIFLRNANPNAPIGRTGIHEIWHALSRFVPDDQRQRMVSEYQRNLEQYIKKNPWFLAFVGRYSLTPEQYQEYIKFAPKEAEQYLSPVIGDTGEVEAYQIRFTRENYRFVNADEYMAETLADIEQGKQKSYDDTVWGAAKRLFDQIIELARQILKPDVFRKFYRDLMTGDTRFERFGPLDESRPIYDPEDRMSDTVRYSDISRINEQLNDADYANNPRSIIQTPNFDELGFTEKDRSEFKHLVDFISYMPPNDQEIFVSVMNQESAETVAKKMDIPVSEAKSLISSAKSELRREMQLVRDGNEMQNAAKDILKNERQFSDVSMGIAITILPKTPDIPISSSEVRSLNPDVEKRWKKSRVSKPPITVNVKDKIAGVKNAIVRPHFAQNLDPKTQGNLIEWMRQFIEIPSWARSYTQNLLSGLLNPLGPKGYDVYSRNIILSDLVKDIDSGLYTGKELPFGYKNEEEVKADLTHFQGIANKFKEVKNALDQRKRLVTALRDQLVERGLLNKDVKNFDDYYRHQVLQYYNAQKQFGVGSSRPDQSRFGWQKERTGSAKDYSTDYLAAEAEYLSQAFSKLKAMDMLAALRDQADVLPALKKSAKTSKVDWETLIPPGYTVWQPAPGNVFYWTKTIDEQALDEYFNKNVDILPDQIKDTLAKGSKRTQWVIPEGLAKDLDNLRAPNLGLIANIATKVNSGWKYWTLFNPTRAAKYNINNLSGDIDALTAYAPSIVKDAPGIAKELFPMLVGKKPMTPEMLDLIQKGVINSGITAQEIGNLSDTQWFKFLNREKFDLNIAKKYFKKVEDVSNFRESIFRIAAYRYFLKRLNKGDKGIVAASDRNIIEAIGSNEDKAARLSRELIGDYGAIGLFGKWMRERLYPFWSWKEINTKRYWRLFANAANEGKSKAAIAKSGATTLLTVGGTKLALRVTQAAALYGVLSLWNNLMFPDEEEELGEQGRRQLHLILGRDSDGNIRTLKIQGSFSDFLGWVGLQDFPQDIEARIKGDKSDSDLFKEGWEAFVGNVVNGSLPILKGIGESLTGKSLYPNPLDPRPIRDPVGHMADLFSMGGIYRKLAGIPQADRGILSQLIFYSSDPGEAAYFNTRSLVAEYLKKQGVEGWSGDPTEKSNALYYYKSALRFDQSDLAEKWLERYYELGGTPKGIKSSIDRANPLGRFSKSSPERSAFMNTLSPSQKATIQRAEKWYRDVYR